jgi:hypothetical protein
MRIVLIQRANKSREFSMKNKKFMFRYYWESLKADLAKSIMTDKKNIEVAKQVSR